MKSVIATTSLLVLAASAAPALTSTAMRHGARQAGGPGVNAICTLAAEPSQQDVVNALVIWRNEVVNVNSFLDSAASITDASSLQNAAQTALNFALGEPNELNVMACIPALATAAENAITSAASGFMGNVLVPLMDVTVNGAPNSPQTHGDLEQINGFRCCTLLPDLDILWLSAAEDEGLVGSVDLSVPRPNACASINC